MKWTADLKFAGVAAMVLFLAPAARASFEPLPVGGRAAGMGEAYSAIVDDVFSLYYNPAGILQINRPEIGTYYSQLYRGLSDNSEISRTFVAYGQPLGKHGRHGGIGASYLALDLPGLYKEESLGLTYGREHRRLWNLGATLKFMRKQIGSDEYTGNAIDPTSGAATGGADPLLAQGRDASGIGLDLGAQYRLTRAYALGFSARNINQPDLGLSGEKDEAPAVLTAAIARRLRAGSLDLEVMNWKSVGNNTRFSVGGEHWFKNGFGLRAGAGIGSRDYQSVSFGASYKVESFQMDYATVYPLQGIESTLGIQQVSLTLRLGKPPVDPLEKQLIKEKEERIRAETEARYAKAERDRLKKQLYDLTEAKTQAEQDEERQAAQRALQEAQAQENREAEQNRTADTRSVFNAYTAALADYNAKVSQGIGLEEKRRLLERIRNEFAGKGVDLSTVTRELASLRSDEAKARKDFELSMNFYRRLVEQGASVDERRSLLERIIQKYKESGIDTSPAEEEMKALR